MHVYIYIHILYVCSYLGNIMTATINHSDPHMKVVGRGLGQVFGLRVAWILQKNVDIQRNPMWFWC